MFKTRVIDKLSEEQEEHVLKETNYCRKQLKTDLQAIKDWLKQQHHLPPCKLKEGDSFFELFLTGCKGSLETVKRKLDNYYTIRSHSDIYNDRDPTTPAILKIKDLCTSGSIPNTSKTGERLLIIRLTDANNEDFDMVKYAQMLSLKAEVHLRQAGYSSRLYILTDFKDCSPGFVFKLSPAIARDLIFLLEEVSPIRVLKIGFVNIPSYIATGLNALILPLFSKKIKERISISSDGLGDLLKYFSPKILPRDYGGESSNPSFKEIIDKWNTLEVEHRSWFLNELSEVVDESKRIKTETSENPYFGAHGSLKKLVID